MLCLENGTNVLVPPMELHRGLHQRDASRTRHPSSGVASSARLIFLAASDRLIALPAPCALELRASSASAAFDMEAGSTHRTCKTPNSPGCSAIAAFAVNPELACSVLLQCDVIVNGCDARLPKQSGASRILNDPFRLRCHARLEAAAYRRAQSRSCKQAAPCSDSASSARKRPSTTCEPAR